MWTRERQQEGAYNTVFPKAAMLLRTMTGLMRRQGVVRADGPRKPVEQPEARAAQERRLRLARQRLAEVFTPARPLPGNSFHLHGAKTDDVFVGRKAERERITRALIEDRLHVLIYGERGMGKTSLANVVVAEVQAADFIVVRHLCSAGSTFDSIMHAIFQDLPRLSSGAASAHAVMPVNASTYASQLPPSGLRPADVVSRLAPFRRLRLVFVIDEFDRVTDENTRTAMADVIKQCSDTRAPISFTIIGVSGSSEQLIGSHPSIQRCLLRLPLPLLEDRDVARIAARSELAGLACPNAMRRAIAQLTRGVPYMAQLLSLRAGQAALEEARLEIRGRDLITSVEAAIAEADPRLHSLYAEISDGERDGAALGVLQAAAIGSRDAFGHFCVTREGRWLRVAGLRADAAAWQKLCDAGAVRQVAGTQPDFFAFTEPMLAPFILHRAVLARQNTPVPAGAEGWL